MPQIDAIVADDYTVIRRKDQCHVIGDVEFTVNHVTLEDAAELAKNLANIAKGEYLSFDKVNDSTWTLKNALFPFEVFKRDWEHYIIVYTLLGVGYSVRLNTPDSFALATARAHYCNILKEIAGVY